MSQLTISQLIPYFKGVDEFQVKAFANGKQGKLVLSREFPIPHPDPESDEAPDGSNYLRLEVITDGKPDYKPYFDEAKKQIGSFIENTRYDYDWRDEETVNYLENILDNLVKKIDLL